MYNDLKEVLINTITILNPYEEITRKDLKLNQLHLPQFC